MNSLITVYKKMLRRFSVFIGTDLSYLMRGGILLTCTQFTSAVFGFLLTLAFANLLPQEAFGTYKYILATYALFSLASIPGLSTSLIETMSKGNDGAYKKTFKTKFKWSLFGTLAALIYAGYLYTTQKQELAVLFAIFGIALPFMESFSIYTDALNAKKKYGTWAITEVLNQATSFLALFFAMYFTDSTVVLIIAYFSSYILVRGCSTYYVYKKHIQHQDYQKDFLSYGYHMTWYQLITRLMASMDQIVLFHFLGPIQVAVYSIALSIPSRFQSVLRISGTLAFPKFANQDERAIKKTLPRKMIIFGLIILVCCVIYILCVPALFKLLFPKYLESVSYTQLMVLYTLSGMTYPLGAYLNAHKKLRENYMVAIINFIVKALCLIMFVPLYGIWGAVIGTVASGWSTIVLAFYILKKKDVRRPPLEHVVVNPEKQ